MNIAIVAAVLVGALMLQTTLLSYVQIYQVQPDLLLIIVTSFAILFGSSKGATVGFFAGLIKDLFIASFFGVHTLSLMLVGFSVGLCERKVFKDSWSVASLLVFITTIIQFGIVYLLMFVTDTVLPFWPVLLTRILPTALYSAVVTIPIYQFIYHFSGKQSRNGNRS